MNIAFLADRQLNFVAHFFAPFQTVDALQYTESFFGVAFFNQPARGFRQKGRTHQKGDSRHRFSGKHGTPVLVN